MRDEDPVDASGRLPLELELKIRTSVDKNRLTTDHSKGSTRAALLRYATSAFTDMAAAMACGDLGAAARTKEQEVQSLSRVMTGWRHLYTSPVLAA
jgi:hypothetical protein